VAAARRTHDPNSKAIQGATDILVREQFSKIECLFGYGKDPACRAALRMIRATIEEHCPPGALMSEEQANGHYGPTVLGEAEAISAAIVATVQRLSFDEPQKLKSPPTGPTKTV
jgi:hypothetical protein